MHDGVLGFWGFGVLGLLGMYFDAAVVFVTSQTLFLRLALAILWATLDLSTLNYNDLSRD